MWTQLKINQFFRLQSTNSLPEIDISHKKNPKLDSSEQENAQHPEPSFTDISLIFNSQDM
jgi:hypothetical protein